MRCTFLLCGGYAEYYAESTEYVSLPHRYKAFCGPCFRSLNPLDYMEITKEEFDTSLVIES